jgi:excisionase family DNA binding protein
MLNEVSSNRKTILERWELAMEKICVSLDEAAKLTSISRFTLRRQIEKGALKVTRVGRRLVIPLAELERLVGSSVNSGCAKE